MSTMGYTLDRASYPLVALLLNGQRLLVPLRNDRERPCKELQFFLRLNLCAVQITPSIPIDTIPITTAAPGNLLLNQWSAKARTAV